MMSPLIRAMRKAAKSFEIWRNKSDSEFAWAFHVKIEKDEDDGGFVAECIEFPGCVTQGETYDEVISNIVDAISGVMTARMRASLRETLGEGPPVAMGTGTVNLPGNIAISV